MTLISLYPNFSNAGGAQNVLLQVAGFFCRDKAELPIVVTATPATDIPEEYRNRARYVPFSIRRLIRLSAKDTVFLSHSRKYSTLLCLLKKTGLLRGAKIVHVAHNLFYDKRRTTLFPDKIIAVSHAVKENLVNYFGVPDDNVTVIYNGITDRLDMQRIPRPADGIIKILLAGRIDKVKQQVELVKHLRGRVPENVRIYFAGTGADEGRLKEVIDSDTSFVFTGHLNLQREIYNYDYLMLFSEKEGLPLSLIEGCMYSKPLISNTIPSVLEVNRNGYNGYVFNDFEDLAAGLQILPMPESAEYKQLACNSRKQYLEHFTEEEMRRAYIRFMVDV